MPRGHMRLSVKRTPARSADGAGSTSTWFQCRAKARWCGIAGAARTEVEMEINPTNNPDVTGDDREEREEAVYQADDTGLLQQQREITDDEIEENLPPPGESQ